MNYQLKQKATTPNMSKATTRKSLENITQSSSDDEIQTPIINPIKIDAFKFLMDSRQKRIGTNSPGKEQQESESNPAEISEHKQKLKKRKLMLEEWTEKKGRRSERKSLDEARGKQIVKQLDNRAKRLKEMLSIDTPTQSVANHLKPDSKAILTDSDSSDEEIFPRRKPVSGKIHTQHLFQSNKNSESYFSENSTKQSSRKDQHKKLIDTTYPTEFLKPTKKQKSSPHIHLTTKNFDIFNNCQQSYIKLSSKETRQIKLSENELPSSTKHVRTPWKMKVKLFEKENVENVIILNQELSSDDDIIEACLMAASNSNYSSKISQHTTKVAPIFLQTQTKSTIDAAIKKDASRALSTHCCELEESIYNSFPSVSHVEQRTSSPFWHLPVADISLSEEYEDVKYDFTDKNALNECFRYKIQNKTERNDINIKSASLVQKDIDELIEELQAEYTEYPVRQLYQTLKDLPKEQEGIVLDEERIWSDKYNPISREHIIGNQRNISELATWLESWLTPPTKRPCYDSDTSSSGDDFCADHNQKEKPKQNQNINSLSLLIGPHGIGKTSTVYALCEQIGVTVIEVNASSRRSGKILLQDLQEATRSHCVRPGDKEAPLSLLLVEDADVVFDSQDEGFVSALKTLARTSLRPIVLTATDANCEHLQAFIDNYPVLRFEVPQESDLVLRMKLLCLIENVLVPGEIINAIVARNNSDVRRTMLDLQFWSATNDNYSQFDLGHVCSDLGGLWWTLFQQNLNPKNIADNLAFSDVIYTSLKIHKNEEPITLSWKTNLTDTLSLMEDYRGYNASQECLIEMVQWMLETNLKISYLETNNIVRGALRSNDIRCRENIHKGHRELNKAIPLNIQLDRRGLAVDYQSMLRKICRLEVDRQKSNRKRGSRFYHYLRSADIQLPRDITKLFYRTLSPQTPLRY